MERGHRARRERGYLRRTSLLYRPPYLFRCAASSVISGIQLANTAYDTQTRETRPTPARPTPRKAVCRVWGGTVPATSGVPTDCGTWAGPCKAKDYRPR